MSQTGLCRTQVSSIYCHYMVQCPACPKTMYSCTYASVCGCTAQPCLLVDLEVDFQFKGVYYNKIQLSWLQALEEMWTVTRMMTVY